MIDFEEEYPDIAKVYFDLKFETINQYSHKRNNIHMIYGYIRVSTDKQTVDNQRFEIDRFCENQKLKVDK